VSGLLTRAAGAFIAPAVTASAPVAGARAAVLGRAPQAIAVAAALAGELRARERAPAALLAVWPGERPLGALAAAGARRLAARLEGRELPAVARGRLAWLALEATAEDAARSLARAEAATDGPSVLAACGPRCARIDALLDERDLVLLVIAPEADPSLFEIALADLVGCRAPVISCPPIHAAPARLLALAGRGRLGHIPSAREVSS